MDGGLFTILLAEDDPNDALLIRRAFVKCGISHPIQLVCDGEEAIAYISGEGKYSDRRQYPFPRFFITDLKMPKKSGFEILSWLRDRNDLSVIPTIVLSSSKQPDDIKLAYRLSANSYFVKPADFSSLQQLVKRIFEYWVECEKPDLPAF